MRCDKGLCISKLKYLYIKYGKSQKITINITEIYSYISNAYKKVEYTSIKYNNGLVYLENDSNLNKNIIFKNNSTIISYIDKYDPVFTNDNVKDERYLNIKKMKYYKDDKEIKLYENLENIKDCIFELNSLDIEVTT